MVGGVGGRASAHTAIRRKRNSSYKGTRTSNHLKRLSTVFFTSLHIIRANYHSAKIIRKKLFPVYFVGTVKQKFGKSSYKQASFCFDPLYIFLKSNNLYQCYGTESRSIGSICFLASQIRIPDPDPLVRGTDPDPSIIKQK